jgi:hypothetical protein
VSPVSPGFGAKAVILPKLACAATQRELGRGGAVGFAIAETRVTKPGSDRQNAPALYVLHIGDLAQPLDHRIVVQNNRRFMIADLRDHLVDANR